MSQQGQGSQKDQETQDRQPWDILPEENGLWYERFTKYRLQGPTRSRLGVYNNERLSKGRKKRGSVPSSWVEASEKFQWRERAFAFDQYIRDRVEADWERRQEQLREREWELAQAMAEKAASMLQFPLVEKIVSTEDGETVIIAPVRWSMSDIPRLSSTLSKLGRLASGMETDRPSVDIDPGRRFYDLLEKVYGEDDDDDGDGDGDMDAAQD
jgi:hypothetical protein